MRKVLVVEDDSNVAGLVTELLLEEGYIAIHASDVDSGWASLISEDPDAAILDLYGRETGWDLLDRIRASEHFGTMPVVILTGVTGEEVAQKASSKGAEYLTKPFTPAALMDRLRRAMRAAGRAPGVRAHAATLLTSSFWIEGNLHVTEELERFTDAWEALVRDPREYIPITEATVKMLDGRTVLATADVIEVQKTDISIVMPGSQ